MSDLPPQPLPPLPAAGRFSLLHWALLAGLLTGTFGTRIYRLAVPDDLYWDEIYFGFTVREILAGNRSVYDPLATPPPGMAYEWTHPPLGKLIAAGTMALTPEGEAIMARKSKPGYAVATAQKPQDVWGMRLSSVIFGTVGVALVVLVTFLLTRSPPAGLLAGLLYATDGLNFVQSRIATTDIHMTAFLLAAVAFYVAWRRREGASNWLLLGAGVMCGATLSVKWVGVFLIALLGADLLVLWLVRWRRHDVRTILAAGVCLVLVPAAIYMASHIHYFLMGYGWGDFVALQKQMWSYHTGLKTGHANQARPWQWVLNLRPMWMYVENTYEGGVYTPTAKVITTANIYNLGNGVVLYFGLIAVAWTAVRFAWRRAWEGGFLLAAYLIFWVPWIWSPRVMFSYHYMPSTAFLCVASGWLLKDLSASRRAALTWIPWAVPTLAVIWLVVFYPDYAAVSVPLWWAEKVYFCIPSWR